MRIHRYTAAVAAWTTAFMTVLTCASPTHAQGAAPAPPEVTKAFQQSYPGAVLSGVTHEEEDGRIMYRVTGVDKGRRRLVLYDRTARAIEVSEQVDEKDLPKPVADAMHSHPRAIYVTGLRVLRDGRVTYRLTLRGTRKTEMIAKADGTVLSFR